MGLYQKSHPPGFFRSATTCVFVLMKMRLGAEAAASPIDLPKLIFQDKFA